MPIVLFFFGGIKMDLLNDKIKKIYLKFLLSAFGSALITSIYGLVDMIMVGKYHGPSGSAAIAVVAPFWNIIYGFGLLIGLGGSILYSSKKGKNQNNDDPNEFFSISLALVIIISLVLWVIIAVFEKELLYAFGCTDDLYPLSSKYLIPVKFTVPIFLFTQFVSAFLRNDNDPFLATLAVIVGGVFNIFGDYFLVFTLDLGILGAGIATACGAFISLIIMSIHFFKKSNTLKLVKAKNVISKSINIVLYGNSSFIVDLSMGILTIIFNHQILKYFGENELAIYGVIINISTFVQCVSYGVGQAAQPIISINFGAKKYDRIKELLKLNIITSFLISIVMVFFTMLIPNSFINLFMKPTKEVLEIAPLIIRLYALSFIFLPVNVYSTYYFQSILKPNLALFISVLRGIALSGLLLIMLPKIFNSTSIWLAMPITELIVFLIVILFTYLSVKAFNKNLLNQKLA